MKPRLPLINRNASVSSFGAQMKKQLVLVIAVLMLGSCASPRPQRVMVDGKAFDLAPGLYTVSSPSWQRLSSFLDRADCTVNSSCTQGISVRRGKDSWKCRLSTNEVMNIFGSIQKRALAVVELSEYVEIDNLVRQNAEVMRLVASQGFREVIVVTRESESEGLRINDYIVNFKPGASAKAGKPPR